MGKFLSNANATRRKALNTALLFRAVALAFLLIYMSVIATAVWLAFGSSAGGRVPF